MSSEVKNTNPELCDNCGHMLVAAEESWKLTTGDMSRPHPGGVRGYVCCKICGHYSPRIKVRKEKEQ